VTAGRRAYQKSFSSAAKAVARCPDCFGREPRVLCGWEQAIAGGLFRDAVLPLRAIHPERPVVIEHEAMESHDPASGDGTGVEHLRAAVDGDDDAVRIRRQRDLPRLYGEIGESSTWREHNDVQNKPVDVGNRTDRAVDGWRQERDRGRRNVERFGQNRLRVRGDLSFRTPPRPGNRSRAGQLRNCDFVPEVDHPRILGGNIRLTRK
jgi:hypothetical protein